MLVDDPPGSPAAFADGVRSHCRRTGIEIVDVVPAARTVLITCRTVHDLDRLAATIDAVAPVPVDDARHHVEIPVRYDGADLDEVADAVGVGRDDVIASHGAVTYVAAFCGFAPGFAYLDGLPELLHLPRRATPRTEVPAGSVAIASSFTAVYPRRSPGGWWLLGHTELEMFDHLRTPAALIEPGTSVRFVPA